MGVGEKQLPNLVDLLILLVLHCRHLALHSQAFEIKAIFDMG